MQEEGLATLLIELLTPHEEEIDRIAHQLRSNVSFLADRVVSATNWLRGNEDTSELDVGYFSANIGGAVAITAAAKLKDEPCLKAIVCRGSRPDLAHDSLRDCKLPTLLLVGESGDTRLVQLNQTALDRLPFKGNAADLLLTDG